MEPKQVPEHTSSPSTPTKGCSPAARLRTVPLLRWIDHHYKDVMVGLMAAVAVFAGVVAYLETWAGNHYAVAVRQGQTLAMDALGYDTSSRQQGNHDTYLYNTWNEWDWRRGEAADYDPAQAGRAAEITELIAPLTPLLDKDQPYFDPENLIADRFSYHVDTNLITTTMLLEERAFTIKAARVWNGKSDGFVTILTVLAVSLFLLGLASTLGERLRYLFAGVGLFLVATALIATLNLTLSPVPAVPSGAIAHYAQGMGASYVGDYEQATEAFDDALEAEPRYGNAYYQRAKVHLWLGEHALAIADYDQAIGHGRDQASTYWELGWAYYLLGDYASALKANYRALEKEPHLVPVVMNTAATLLTGGQVDAAMAEFNRGLSMAAAPDSPVPADWNLLYLREAANDLDRLIATLDGQTGFYREPDLSQIQDSTALRSAAEGARRFVKEGTVAIQVGRFPITERTEANLSPIAFARSTGQNGELLGESDTFARGELSVVASVSFEGLPQGVIVSRRVTRLWTDEPGMPEALPTMGQNMLWNGAPQGTWQDVLEAPWPGDRGFKFGSYVVEYYVDGQLLQSGSFGIPDEETPLIGSIVFATECARGGVPEGQSSVFPAQAAEIVGAVLYSGIPEGSTMQAQWYRDGILVHSDQFTDEGPWGRSCFSLTDVPIGTYRLDLRVKDQDIAPQSATFEVREIEGYLQTIGERPDDWRFQFDLGNALANASDPEAAARYRRATELEPQCAKCYHRWWVLLVDQGHYEEAVEKLLQAIELNPKEYTYLADLGRTHYALGDEAKAIDAFRQAILANPAYTYNAWGDTLYDQELYLEAATRYRQAIELAPNQSLYHYNLAWAYYQMGELEQAIAAFERAAQLAAQAGDEELRLDAEDVLQQIR